jgi:hypothetical protein
VRHTIISDSPLPLTGFSNVPLNPSRPRLIELQTEDYFTSGAHSLVTILRLFIQESWSHTNRRETDFGATSLLFFSCGRFSDQNVELIYHRLLVPKRRMYGAVPLLPHVSLVWGLSCPATRHAEAKGERKYSSYSFFTSALDGVSDHRHAPAALFPRGKDPRYPLYRKVVSKHFWSCTPIISKNNYHARIHLFISTYKLINYICIYIYICRNTY